MNRFAIARPRTAEEASALLADGRFALPVLKAGGMDLLDRMKEGLVEPDLLVDVRSIGSGDAIADAGGAVRIAATATLAEIAAARLVRERAPALAQAAADAATPQVRNAATIAGNLLQRPRCWYFRNAQFDCLKKGGHTCFAVEGDNRYHAIFGGGPCHIVHPSNLAPALVACGALVHVTGGDRASIPIEALFHAPDRGITSEHELAPAEVVTHVTVEPAPRSGFHAVKAKQSFDWPLVLAAVAVTVEGGAIAAARVCAGAVAPVPWRLPRVEAALRGVRPDDDAALRAACSRATESARPMTGNACKLDLLPVAIARAVRLAAGVERAEADR
jgi:xanthine dehydrogenase YagS FAD-binding subunit